ncbi:MAG: hypothetical protein FWE05_04865 [Defluviitaleaceae bacterium]|nr:hypothetical protein [Defluviitaleaceae bacterium]
MIILPQLPAEETMKTLIKAKGFLEHSRHHYLLGGEFDVMISIHNLDNAIEYMLRILIRHLDIENITGKTINSCELSVLVGDIQKFLKDNTNANLSYVMEIKKIRELRNLVQHAMILPVAELKTYLVYGEKFFETCLSKFFGISVNEIQFSTLIENDVLKQMLVDAEKQIDNGSYLEAIANCRNIFEYAYFLNSRESSQRIARAPLFSKLKNIDNDLYYYLAEIDKNLDISTSGINLAHYKHFYRYIQHLPKEYCADWNGNTVLQRAWEKEDANFCYSFAANAVLNWEKNKINSVFDYTTLGDKYNSETILNDLIITDDDYVCSYIDENVDSYAELLYVNGDLMSLLKRGLQANDIYLLGSNSYKNGSLNSVFERYVRLNHFHIKLVVNLPEIWEVTLNYTIIPFAYCMLKGDTFDIDSFTPSLLKEMGVEEDAVNGIIDFISENDAKEKIKKSFEIEKFINSLEIDATYKISSSLIALVKPHIRCFNTSQL